MVQFEAYGLMAGAILLGAVHGIEPGHGWPVAASYALDRANKWVYGFAASFIIGVGHLVSSIAMVGVFFYAKSYFSLTEVDEPITLVAGLNLAGITDLQIGGPVSIVAGVLLIGLGLREYYGGGHSHDHGGDGGHDHDDTSHDRGHSHDGEHNHANHAPEEGNLSHGHVDHSHDQGHDHANHGHEEGDHSHGHVDYSLDQGHDHANHGHEEGDHSHGHVDHGQDHGHSHGNGHEHGHDHEHGDHGHDHEHVEHGHSNDDHSGDGLSSRVLSFVPFVGGHAHSHGDPEGAADRGLLGIAWFAFVLGFAHEEEFEIIALCAGSQYCLELMLVYATTVIAGIVGLTMLLIAGYHHYEERVEAFTPYLPVFSAVVLVVMGLGFITGLF